VIVVVGTDATVVNDALRKEISEALGDLDPALVVEDIVVRDATIDTDAGVAGRLLDALNTPPFLVPRRVVVVRNAQALAASDVQSVLDWCAAPTPGIELIVGVVGAKSNKLVKAASRVVDVAVGPRPKERQEYVAETFASYGLSVTASLCDQVAKRLGDDVARVDSLARTLQSVYGTAPLRYQDVEPYVGEAGDVPEWDLTDAIDRGDVSGAITTLRRMLDSGARSGLQIVNILQRHYLRMAQLDGSGVGSPDDAAAMLGIHRFRAEKTLTTLRSLGSERIAYAVHALTKADTDLKGGVSFGGRDETSDVDATEVTVSEILVARLATLSGRRRRS